MRKLVFKTHVNNSIQEKLFKKFVSNNPGVEIEFEAEPEDLEPDFEPEEERQRFLKKCENDHELNYCGVSPLWFCAKVTVKYKEFEYTDYLGGCSYKSYDDFKSNSGYCYDMISSCIEQINSDIKSHNAAICYNWKVRSLKRLAQELDFVLVRKSALIG